MSELTDNKTLAYPAILKYVLIHFVLLGIAFVIYAWLMHIPTMPQWPQFLAFDGGNYDNIRKDGYSFTPNDPVNIGNVAFFPGFPFLWRLTGLGTIGISLLNLVIFIISFSFLCRYFATNRNEIFVFLSLPTLCFLYVPYSEALFFLTSSILLVGLLKRNHVLIMAGLFLCSLCRSASNVFIPAIIIMELLVADNEHRVRNMILYSLSALLGVFLVALLQFQETGQWMGFITSQSRWEVGFRKPEWPFRTWHGMEYLDGATLLAGVVVCVILIYMGLRFLKGEKTKENKPLIFSLLFVAGLTIFPIFFKAGNLFSLSRYIIPTSFFFITGIYLVKLRQFSFKELAIAFMVIFAFWMIAFRGFRPVSEMPGYLMISLYLCLYLLINNKSVKMSTVAVWLLYAINIFLQAHLFYRHIGGHWVG